MVVTPTIKILNIQIIDSEDINNISLSNNLIEENVNTNTLVGDLLTDNALANQNANFSISTSSDFNNDF